MTLSNLGWTSFFQQSFDQLPQSDLIPARITRHNRQLYLAESDVGTFSATLLGRLLYDESAELPVVGDWVALQTFDDPPYQNAQAVIHHVLPRFSAFMRKEAGHKTRKQLVAANINTVFLVSGLDNDFNIRRIERYLVQTHSSGAKPVILLNKADLCDDLDSKIRELKRVAPEIPVLPLSAIQSQGIDQLEPYVQPGETVAFIGSSGVGKSSLVNLLAGNNHFKTGAVREDDSRGRHTTSHRELIFLPSGGVVMDTPGMRELQLWGDEDDLHQVFTDIEELSQQCRFNNCSHDSEPGCALHEAVELGELDEDRFLSYMKLRKEIAFLERRKDEVSMLKNKKREKDFGKMMKEMKKHNPKR